MPPARSLPAPPATASARATAVDVAAATPAPTPFRTVEPTVEAIDHGGDLFRWKGCIHCHGPRAEGLVGPRIARTALPIDAVLRQVRTPRNAYMPPFTMQLLSDEEVQHIYAFLQSLPAD